MTTRKIMTGSALAIILACGAASAHTGAQPVAPDPQLIMELNSARLQQAAATSAAQAEVDARLKSVLKQLIESAPTDPQAPTWMLDLAGLHLGSAVRSCDDASVMFGIPTSEQTRRVAESAGAAITLINNAEAAAQVAVATLEARLLEPGLSAASAAALAAQIEPILTKLVDVEIAVRIPAMRMDAEALGALAENDQAASSKRRTEALTLVVKGPGAGEASEVHKRLLAASLLVRSAEAQQRDSARRQLEWIVSRAAAAAASESGGSLTTGDWVRLHMALLRCDQVEAAAKLPCPGRGTDWLVDLLLSEAALAATNSSPTAAPPAIAARGAAIAQMLGVIRTHGGGDQELDSTADLAALRALVYRKLGSATGPGTPWSSLDPEVALARAWFLRTADGSLDAEATSLLLQVAGREDAPAPVRARAMWMLATQPISGAKQAGDSRQQLSRIVKDLPRTRLSLVAAARIVESSPARMEESAPCGIVWPDEPMRQEVAAALGLLIGASPADESKSAQLVATLLSGSQTPSVAEFDQAARAFGNLAPASTAALQSAACITGTCDRALAAPLDPSTRDGLLRFAAEWFAARGDDGPRRALGLRLERAESALAAKLESPDRVASELRSLLGTAIDQSGTPGRARLRVLLGIALRSAGDKGEAFPMFRSVTDEFEGDARSADPARREAKQAFWNAWAEMLEFVRTGGSGQSPNESDRIRQAVRLRERLELLDPDLGGEPWAGRIRAASNAKDK